MAKKRGMVASAFTSTRRAIGRYLPGARTEAKAEAAIDNLLVLLRETRKSLRAVARLRGGGKRRSKAKRGAAKRKAARPMRRKRSAKRKSRR
ncbi:MAG TPA: hypothetical protein VG475_06835 [Pseudolabrys sp.]|jgi:hypothetical protein|nr:hypothetical protein [Pseudolabrys sp.]